MGNINDIFGDWLPILSEMNSPEETTHQIYLVIHDLRKIMTTMKKHIPCEIIGIQLQNITQELLKLVDKYRYL